MEALRAYLLASGLMDAPPDTPIFFYRSSSGSQVARVSRGVLLREFRTQILAPAGVPDYLRYTLRSLRPAGATDLAACGVPSSVIQKLGKWSSDSGIMPYDRVDHHMISDLARFREAMLSL